MTTLENLDLSGVDVSSSVPRFLANFSSLRAIRLEDCQLQDEFPSAIFHLPNLKYLVMARNPNLTGFLPEFHNKTTLEILNLFSTGFAGIIPESIGNLIHLEVLILQRCDFSGRIPDSLSNLTQLTELYLSANEFTGVVPSLASLSKLTVLVLGRNSLERGSRYDWINKLTKLNVLDLHRMNIHGEILPYLTNLTQLSNLLIGGNFIFGRIPSSFMNLTQLLVLDLKNNQLQGEISSSFLKFKSLQMLYISSNNFSGTVGPDSFYGLNKLKLFLLDDSGLSFVTTTNYTNATLPELEYVGLSSCNLKEFPAFLRFQMKMSFLFLEDNEIEGFIPNWVWNNSRETLHSISLRNNQLKGQLPIPPGTIVFYDVSNNNLTGEIPPQICELKSLQLLDLSSNKMSGTLPPCLDNLSSSLSVLNLKQNSFQGPVMNTCRHGSLFKTIDLSENQFTGQVSKSLANCTNLEFLSLADNSFKDVFPVWLGSLPKLQVLILRSNKLYGAIKGISIITPQFLKLRIIDISNNDFSAPLPDKLFQTWNAMKSVYVGNSSAMGSLIPLNSYTIDNIPVGFIPMLFPYSMTLINKGVKRQYNKILNILTAVDLSCNNFEGQIPQSLQDLHGLESLNLSNNHFTGHILPSLGNLKNLESLDLSQNNLSGQIPQQLLQLGFLAIFNVSFNHLDGRIPQGKQFNTFENSSYFGNPQLCGKPLSNECEHAKVSTVLPPPTSSNEYESLLPSDIIDWMVILLGVGSGFIIGIVIGSFLYGRYSDQLLERLGLKKDKWVRPLRNTRKN